MIHGPHLLASPSINLSPLDFELRSRGFIGVLRCEDMGVAQWPPEYQGLLQQIDVQAVRIIDANHSELVIGKSTTRHPNAGLGVFATSDIRAGEHACPYFVTLVYHNLFIRKSLKKACCCFADSGTCADTV